MLHDTFALGCPFVIAKKNRVGEYVKTAVPPLKVTGVNDGVTIYVPPGTKVPVTVKDPDEFVCCAPVPVINTPFPFRSKVYEGMYVPVILALPVVVSVQFIVTDVVDVDETVDVIVTGIDILDYCFYMFPAENRNYFLILQIRMFFKNLYI